MTIFCPACGRALEANSSFCGGCGQPMGAAAPPSPENRPTAAGNPFTQFSSEMNRHDPAARSRGPGKLLSLIVVAAIIAAAGTGVWLIHRAIQLEPDDMSRTRAASGATAPDAGNKPTNIKTDATITDVAGLWVGKIRFSRITGFDLLPADEKPDNYEVIIDKALNSDQPCKITVYDDGEWKFYTEAMNAMFLDSNGLPEMKITPRNGEFSISDTMDVDGSRQKKGALLTFDGAIVNEVPLRLVGRIYMEMIMDSTKITVEGHYSVFKLP